MCDREKNFDSNAIVFFYYRRVKRILPTYLLVVILSLTCSRLFLFEYLQPPNLESAKYALLFTTNIEATDSVKEYQTMLTKAADLFTHTWSIAVEMQFYAVFPAIFMIFKTLPDNAAMTVLKGSDVEAVHSYANVNNYGYCLAAVIFTNFFIYVPVDGLILRITSTFLTAGLILFHPNNDAYFMSSKYITYIGDISYSLYLVHWPIYTLFRQNNIEDSVGLSCGLVLSLLVAVILTETFEKFCLRADVKTVLYVVTFLYAANLLMISGQENVDFLERERDWVKKLFTPVCSPEHGNSSKVCDIPFSATKMYLEQVLRLNNLFTVADTQFLSYEKCTYRDNDPWGWCDLPKENDNPAHKILVLGNSYATNQGRIVYEMCHSSEVEVKIFTIAACEVLTKSTQFEHCQNSRKQFLEAVKEYKPDVMFILSRYTDMVEVPEKPSKSSVEDIVKEAASRLMELSQGVTDHVYVLNAVPRPHRAFQRFHSSALRKHIQQKPNHERLWNSSLIPQ
ncbi:acyltransferase [Ancylostoma ceylanicum]|uniref:Acyltransferase n=1 Tax=Ancylostoma ceylanicum TaxID=53326 RepID=A0A0D6LME9_9BILA|nr:acyltransferase [Ancylostoma ceylanicum]